MVLGIDYRLAPEYPFPAALDDCCEALDWVCTPLLQRQFKYMLIPFNQVTQHAAEYNMDPGRIGVWGASAGGNLAAALAIRETQRRGRSLRLVSLVVPVTAHPQVQILSEQDRKIEKSPNELLFENSPTAPEAVIKEFEKLYGLCCCDIGPGKSLLTCRAQTYTQAAQLIFSIL